MITVFVEPALATRVVTAIDDSKSFIDNSKLTCVATFFAVSVIVIPLSGFPSSSSD